MAEEITSIADAFNAAKLDSVPEILGEGTASVDSPVEATDAYGRDETEASDPDLQLLIDEMVGDADPQAITSIQDAAFWDTTVDIGDGVSVPLSKLRDGYMMQSDYTRKTQALSEQRKQVEIADSFYQNYLADPQEFARAIAVENGWLTENQRTPVRDVPGAKLPTAEEFDASVQQLVDERLRTDERFERMQQVDAQAVVDTQFANVQAKLGVSLPNAAKQEIVDLATQRGVYDLELVTEYWIGQQRSKRRSGEQLKQSASARPQSAGAGAADSPSLEVNDFADAVRAAKAEMDARA